jgi:hypothetical protein
MIRMIKGKEEVWITCDCSYADHSARLARWDSDTDEAPQLYLDVHLNPEGGFWKRIWTALRYIFVRHPCRFGCFAEMVLNEESAEKIENICHKYRKDFETWVPNREKKT